jgi:large-conductance mechanosensitive channel
MVQYIIISIILALAVFFSIKKIAHYFSNQKKCIDPSKKCEGCELHELCGKKQE